jgi:hypothetical protein
MLTALPAAGALMMQARRDFQSAQVSPLRAMVGLSAFIMNGLLASSKRACCGGGRERTSPASGIDGVRCAG